MPKYLVECDMTGAGVSDASRHQAFAQSCNEGVDLLAGRAQWLHTYLTEDTLVAFYIADERASVAEHVALAGLDCERILEIHTTLDPTSAEHHRSFEVPGGHHEQQR